MERSLVIIKPDGTVRRRIGALVINDLLERNYSITAFKEMKVSEPLAKLHYAVHETKPFFPWLVDFITSARVLVMIFEGNAAIQGIRDALGATFVQKAAPDTLRGRYGIWAGINIAHASDSLDTANNEIGLWIEEGGLIESDDAERLANVYVQKYISSEIDYTLQIRKIVREAIETENQSHEVLNSLEEMFEKDADKIKTSEVKALSLAIYDFIRDEIKKGSKI
jgi:nucleoside-diphosphate kinase